MLTWWAVVRKNICVRIVRSSYLRDLFFRSILLALHKQRIGHVRVLAEEEDLVELGPEVEADVEVLSRAIRIDFLVFIVFRIFSFGRRLLWKGGR